MPKQSPATKCCAVLLCLLLTGCISDDFDWVDRRAKPYYEERGFEVAGYQGYNMWTFGRCYWYTLRRGNVTYQSCLLRWGNEVHEYSLRAVDAIKGTSP